MIFIFPGVASLPIAGVFSCVHTPVCGYCLKTRQPQSETESDIVTQTRNYLTADEAVEYAGVSRSTLYRWIDDGLLPRYTATRGTNRIYFTASDLDQILTPTKEKTA